MEIVSIPASVMIVLAITIFYGWVMYSIGYHKGVKHGRKAHKRS